MYKDASSKELHFVKAIDVIIALLGNKKNQNRPMKGTRAKLDVCRPQVPRDKVPGCEIGAYCSLHGSAC